MDESAIHDFWEAHPCGDHMVGGLTQAFCGDYERFFRSYDAFRYQREEHILKALDRFDFDGKRVLEIGVGQGADAEQLIKRGAIWSGLDLTEEAINRMRIRAEIRNLPVSDLKVGSALAIPYPDDTFDIVFSHGVLHHIPEIEKAQREIRRVLKVDGSLIAMLYAKNSLNYQFAIRIIRRLGLTVTTLFNIKFGDIYEEHRKNAKTQGLISYLNMSNFIHRSTDGPRNPYSKVYDLDTICRDFVDFDIVDHFKLWMHAPPLPVHSLPGGSLLGWHLWVHLKPKKAKARQ